MKSLIDIQNRLNAPKNLFNGFGGYKYRSCESILEAVKPLLAEHGALLTLTDEVVTVGDRHYITAEATYRHDDFELSVTASAREADAKKGMDESQLTGTASSYARKYALNGIFLIDDARDADTDEFRRQTQPTTPAPKKAPARKQTQPRPPEIDPEATITYEAAKKLSDLVALIDAIDKKWWSQMQMDFGFLKSTQIRQRDYNTIITQATKRLTALRNEGKLDADYKPIQAENQASEAPKKAKGKTVKEASKKPAEAEKGTQEAFEEADTW